MAVQRENGGICAVISIWFWQSKAYKRKEHVKFEQMSGFVSHAGKLELRAALQFMCTG